MLKLRFAYVQIAHKLLYLVHCESTK